MTRFKIKILAVASAVAVAGGLAVAGVTAASASSAARSGASGIERFQLMTTSATATTDPIIAIGNVFTAGGVDHPGNKADLAVFPNGTFRIRHSSGTGTQRFNPKTCLAVISLHGTYSLVRGTGAYAGIRGHGIYQLSILFVAARNSKGKCSQTMRPVAYEQIIRAQGPVTL